MHLLRDANFVQDAATDALLSYVKRPAQYDPSKRGLLGYLVMAAEGDLKNALAKIKRRRAHEIAVDDVELRRFGGKDVPRVADADVELAAKEMATKDAALFTDLRDREAAMLIRTRERSTQAFVELWKLQGLARDEQRREVKRRKDRIKKVLERHRGDE